MKNKCLSFAILVFAIIIFTVILLNVFVWSAPAAPSQTDTQTPPNSPAGQNNCVVFPYRIPGTTLVVQRVISYEGIFLEDGSDEKVSGVAAILVKNAGTASIEYTSITLTQKENTLLFEASVIPAGASIIIQEKNRQNVSESVFSSCTAIAAGLSAPSAENVLVTENDDGSLTVQNLSDQQIPCVRIFYKFYMYDENAYVGGITYNAKVVDLMPNESKNITPSHYVCGYSKVVMVRQYSSAE